MASYRDYQRQRQLTLGDLLLENRIIFLQGEIHDGNANELVMKLLYLQSENRRKDIHFYLNSPGGDVSASTVAAERPPASRTLRRLRGFDHVVSKQLATRRTLRTSECVPVFASTALLQALKAPALRSKVWGDTDW